MSDQKSIDNISRSSMSVDGATIVPSRTIRSRQCIRQSFLLIWLDARVDQSNKDCQNTLMQLRNVVYDINIFTQRDEAIDFLTDVPDTKASLIVEGTISQHIVPLIHDIPQLNMVYIFSNDKSEHEQWIKQWAKIKGVYTDIQPIYQALQQAIKQYNHDSISASFVPAREESSNQNLDQLEASFMYTQIFKEIFLEMKHNKQSIEAFILFWRQHYINDTFIPKVIVEFERDYYPQSAITWYTREPFVFEMVNRALRILEAETLIIMGFFIHDLHRQIQELHQTQVGSYHANSFTVYRGQGLLKTDFEQLVKSIRGLMSFNNFLSTSTKREVSYVFAQGALGNSNMVGILFKIAIDSSISSVPFASIRELSYFQTEEEVLLSMHAVFRIDEINKIDDNDPLYQVNLTLTANDDEQLRTLTKHIREKVMDQTQWYHRLGSLLLILSQFDKAEELYNILLEQTSDVDEKAFYYHQLGGIKREQSNYQKAIEYYEKTLEINEKTLSPSDPALAASYNNIGNVYDSIGEYSKALSFYEKGLSISQQSLSLNHPNLASSYNNIGNVYDNMGEYSKALSFHEKALEIYQKAHVSNHPDMAISYNGIGRAYDSMGEYSKALSFFEKSREIFEKTLPVNHPLLATSYNNVGWVYSNMGEYLKALSFYEKSLAISKQLLPSNCPDLATSYQHIGEVYNNMGEYSKALSFHEKALEIYQKTLPPNHPLLGCSYNNIGEVYNNMGEYSKALSFYEKAREIFEENLPPNHPWLGCSYNNIGGVHRNMGDYLKALSFFENNLEISQKTLSSNHPDLATSYDNIGGLYYIIRDCSKALSFFEKALDIRQKTLSPNHLSLGASYNNIGGVYSSMREYSKALSFYEKTCEIFEQNLPVNHPDLATFYSNIACVYENTREYPTAVSYFERSLNIFQCSLPSNHPSIKAVQENLERLRKKL